jgi:virginiamycin A acetyltransferase
MDSNVVYPRPNDRQTCYLKNIVTNKNIVVGDYTYYHDFVDPLEFERRNVLYHYPINNDKLIIGKYCSIASGVKFLFNGGNHKNGSFVNFPFAIFPGEWEAGLKITDSWDNKGDIVIGNDVWIGCEAVIMAGVTIGDGARIGTRAVVTRDVKPYQVVGGVPAKVIKSRFDEETIELLEKLAWWDMDEKWVEAAIPILMGASKQEMKKLLENR